MSPSNASQTSVSETRDGALGDEVPLGRLEDSEIQRLVELSRDAGYQRTDHVPVKSVEVFEPRSLVSIAMAAQRRREAEIRTAMAAGAVVADGDATLDAESQTSDQAMVDAQQDQLSNRGDAEEIDASGGMAGGMADGVDDTASAEPSGDGQAAAEPHSTSREDFEAGRAEGVEEGRKIGLQEGKAEGLEEGRAAGRAEASAQLERAIQAFESAAARLTDLTAIDSIELGDSINAAILRLASERAGRAIAEQPDGFADRIESLLATIRTASGQPAIRLNTADLGSIQALVETREKLRHCSFTADPALASGDLSVTVGTIGIDDMIIPSDAAAMSTQTNPDDAQDGPSDG